VFRPHYPGKDPPVPNDLEAGTTAELVWTFIEEKLLLLLLVFEPRNFQSVAKHNSAYSPHLKYLSTAQYHDDL
jgi:hypothetical protein